MIHLRTLASLLLILCIHLSAMLPINARPLESFGGLDTSTSSEDSQKEQRGLRFRLSEGSEAQSRSTENRVAPAAKLSDAEAQNVLKRLPDVKAEEADEQDFAMRDRSLPPPRTGKTIKATFPQTEQLSKPDTGSAGPLEVLRVAPEGDVPLAPQLSVTFSQPMVAVSSQTEVAAENLPVKLSPQPQGRWRWVGTKTLLFEPAGRFPMATNYSVTIPAGARSANGNALNATRTWSFATPAPVMKNSYPSGTSNARDALMFVEFDQGIDPASVLSTVNVSIGKNELKVRLATQEEVEADTDVRNLSHAAVKGRWLAFRAINPQTGETKLALPADSNISVQIGPGTPSAEGPRTTAKAQSFSFKTYSALRVDRHECSYNEKCTPFDSWTITFSNALDAEAFQKSQVRVEPEIRGLKTSVYYNNLTIDGIKKGRTTYRVTLDKNIRDIFGQTLEGNSSVTFNVVPALPSLSSASGSLVVQDPTGPREFSVFSVNHNRLKVRLYSVQPEDWEQFFSYMNYVNQTEENDAKRRLGTPPGRLVSSKIVGVKSVPDEMTETRIDLSPALENGPGHTIVLVEPVGYAKKSDEQTYVVAWVEATNIGLDAFVDNTDLIGWTTSLKDGTPLKDVSVSLPPMKLEGVTGADGLVRLHLDKPAKNRKSFLIARQGRDSAILPEHENWWQDDGGWHRKEDKDSLHWYVFDDRKMYRPGEEVHIKGWIRHVGAGKEGDVGLVRENFSNISYTLNDSRGNEISKGALPINALGGFDTSFKLPGTMNLGDAHLVLRTDDDASLTEASKLYVHNFQVQEFRRPEFEVSAQASNGPHVVGGSAVTTVSANYFAGGALPDADVTWRVTSTPGHFTPPNRDDFTFGKWEPWWIETDVDHEQNHSETYKAKTDASGKHSLRIDFDSVNPPRPSNVTAEASVEDVNRQTWTARTSLLVHPADLYVGIRSDRTFVEQGQPLNVEAIVTDLDGKALAGRAIKMRAVLFDWIFKNGEWKQEETNAEDCNINSGADAVKCSFHPKEGGRYRVTAQVLDDKERRNESELTLWVAGGKTPPERAVKQETVGLIPDRKEYRPGETAQLLVQTPFYPADGLVTLRRSGILRSEHFKMDGPSYTLRVPVDESLVPNVHVQVDLVGASARTDDAGNRDEKLPKRPAYASGELNLSISTLSRKLTVQATPRDKALEPGGETTVNVNVQDAAGKPVAGSEVAVVVVDESVLALTNYKLDDPLSIFYREREAGASDYYLREKVQLVNPNNLVAVRRSVLNGAAAQMVEVNELAPAPKPMATPMNGRVMRKKNGAVAFGVADKVGEAAEAQESIRLRENFNALAVFSPSIPTDSNGQAQVKVKVPDNLTRYRVMAVAVANGKQFGSGESAITARQPLMARPSAPRFLNFGDRFELPVVLQNQTDSPMTVDVAVRATNAELTNGIGRRVTVPANDRVEVRFPTSASRAGTARFQFGALSGRYADASEISLPVWTPATTEAFATYGELDEGSVVQPVKTPSNVFKQFGGLEIETSSTQLQELTDAVLYLVSYPYECSEQLSSRILAIAALKDVLTAFKAKEMPTPSEMQAAVERDIKRLQGMQNEDGGFGFWKRGDESWPYLSIHVAHALERAKEKGFNVPPEMLEKSKRYLRDIEKRTPSYYGIEARRALVAYALYVRDRMGDKDTGRARRLIAEAGLENLSLESAGWLLSVLNGDANSRAQIEAIRRHLNNRATETAATAHFASSYSDADYLLLNSDRRADGVILEALIKDQPQSDLIPKIVRGLLAQRSQGRWSNTQENVFILLALDLYFATYEKATPDFVARAWLGQNYAGSQEFRGRTTDRYQLSVPMRELAQDGATENLILSKEGAGRLYYRVGMKYAPASLRLDPADYGFTVERVYEAIDDPKDVRREADGTWHIRAGAQVRVRLTMAAHARRYHVALVDPLPAGLEALNPALAVTGSVPQDQKEEKPSRSWWYWSRTWFEHQNLRDERAEAFTSLLWEGVYNYSYVTRATTPGVFVVPPTKAEEMYHPETFGRGATDRVVIE
ncbi:MAG: alpha-2-macroglobulin family protein [Pyrinomonadaceae bacterium]